MKVFLHCILVLILSFNTKAQCPIIKGAMANSCGANEGINEFVLFTTTNTATAGSYSLYYGDNAIPSLGLPVSIMAGANATAQNGTGTITSTNGCVINQVTSASTAIPGNSNVIFIPSNFDANYDVTAICSLGNLYIVYIDITSLPSTWNAIGVIANNPSTPAYLQISNGAASCSSGIRSYNNGWVSNTDGNTVWWDALGNAAYNNNGCTSIIPPVTITPSNPLSVCAGNTSTTMAFTTIGNPDEFSIDWDAAANSAGFIDVVNAMLTSSPLTIALPAGAAAATTYNGTTVVKNTVTGIISTAQNISVTINPNVTPLFNPVTDICSGSAAPVLPSVSTNGIAGTWSPAIVSNIVSAIYTFTPAAGLCAIGTTLSVVVIPMPTAAVSGTNNICSGTSTNIIFNGTPNATVSFNVNGGINQNTLLDAAGTAIINTGNLLIGKTYNLVSVTSPGMPACIQNITGQAVVTIKPVTPTPAVIGIIDYCQNEPTTQLTATGNGLLWYNLSSGGVGSTIAPTANTASTGSTDYFVTQTINFCESQREPITVKVYPPPSIPTVSLGALYRCGPGPITLSATASGIIKWYSDAALTKYITSGPAYNVYISTTTSFYVTNTEGNCVSPSRTIIATMFPKSVQVTNFSYSPAIVCPGSAKPVPVTATGFSLGGSFTSSPAGLSFNTITGVINPALSTPGTYTIKYSLGASICNVAGSSTASITINKIAAPVTAFSYGSPVCSNASNPVPIPTAGFTTGGAYSSTPGLSINAATGIIDLAKSTAGIYTITYTITATPCIAGGSSKADITIYASPSVPVTLGNKRCGSGVVNLVATGQGTLNWYSASDLKTILATGANYNPFLSNTANYYVTASNANCTSAAAGITATVFAIPVKPDLGKFTPICSGDKLVLRPGNYDSYLWQDNSTSPTLTVTAPGTYTLIVTSDDGCSNTANISILFSTNCSDIIFPSVFSPNGDQLNDNFGPLPIRNLSFVKNYTLRIFNRYGQIVFNSSNPYEKWDGYFHGQVPYDAGTFIWKAEYIYNNGTKKMQDGHITIVR